MRTADDWLDALGRPDPAAWARADEALATLPEDDPVRLAIERESVDGPEARARATPELAWAAARARHEPFAFDRLVLEHSHSRTIATPDESRATLDSCVALFERRVEQGGRTAPIETARALLALAVAYLADDERAKGRHDEAERELDRAWRLLADPTDPFQFEIRATLHEVRVDLAHATGDHDVARTHAATALRLLHSTVIPARRTGPLWRAGRTDVATDHDAEAVTSLEAAERELPEGLTDPRRLDILQWLAFAEATLGHRQRAADLLERAEPLLDEWATVVMMAQRNHLLGHLAHREERYADAAAHWRASIGLSILGDSPSDAAQTFQAFRSLLPHGAVTGAELLKVLRLLASRSRRVGGSGDTG